MATTKRRNKTRCRLTPLAKRVYDLQLQSRSLEVKLGNLIPKLIEAEQYSIAFQRQSLRHLSEEMALSAAEGPDPDA